ncbi:hypothetical protein H6A08_05300 [Enorma massiliensis]|uniref:hypothetical protein n=1 Tax=Enorma massiliensis TaxID=1472761 RepID=UPI00195B5D62|nr:hypothetical protein [Enorma massiliensis]MBM6783784.1 hypothetical protein [Enorma massiliensis]
MNQSHHLEHDIFVNTPIETLRDRLYAARCVASEPFERGGSGSAEHEGDRETAALNASPDAAFRHVDREPADYQDDWELPALPDEEAPTYGKFDRTRAYDTRTLRILAILEEHTDEEHALSAPRIKTMLDAQNHPGTRPPRVTTSSIRYSIQMLRSFGLNIAGDNHRGYALLSHPIPTEDAELTLSTIWNSAALTSIERRRLVKNLLPLVAPTVRHRFEKSIEQPSGNAALPARVTMRFQLATARQIIERAIQLSAPVTYVLAAAHGEAGASSHRFCLFPEALVESNGAVFVRGRLAQAARSNSTDPAGIVDSGRTFRLDRLQALSMRDGDDVMYVGPAPQVAPQVAPPVPQAISPAPQVASPTPALQAIAPAPQAVLSASQFAPSAPQAAAPPPQAIAPAPEAPTVHDSNR